MKAHSSLFDKSFRPDEKPSGSSRQVPNAIYNINAPLDCDRSRERFLKFTDGRNGEVEEREGEKKSFIKFT